MVTPVPCSHTVASIQIYFEGDEIFSFTGRRGTKPGARKTESGDGVLGGAPSPPARGVGDHCKLPQRDPGWNPRKI